MEIEKTKYDGIYYIKLNNKRLLATNNLTPSKNFFNERLFKIKNEEYREFDPSRSKLAAGIAKNISFLPIRQNQKILYLGASHGYTSSYISDLIGKNGIVFCLDFAHRVVRDLVLVCEERQNMIPILADANKPESYKNRITNVDLIYQDVAQRNQVEILFKNLIFLKDKGFSIIAIKSKSIDSTKRSEKIFVEVEEELKKKLKIIDKRRLDPFERDHMLFICQKK